MVPDRLGLVWTGKVLKQLLLAENHHHIAFPSPSLFPFVMSHHFPYRMFPPQTDAPQPDYNARRAAGGESDFYGQPQPTPSSARQQLSSSSSSSSSAAAAADPPQGSDMALGLLRSYGLEPADLARLAELPEEMLNLDSLPHLLQQLKERRESVASVASAPLSSRRPGSSRPTDAPSSAAVVVKDKWAQIRNQPVQYPLEHVLSAAKGRSFEPFSSPDCRANPRPSHPAAAAGSYKNLPGAEALPPPPPPPPPSSSSSCYMPEYGHRDRTADQGKQGRDDRYERPAHSQPSSRRTAPPPRHSQSDPAGHYGSGPPPRDPHRAQPRAKQQSSPLPPHRAQPRAAERQHGPLPPHHSSSRAGTGHAVAAPAAPVAPSRKEALDFHGSPPGAFPYSCSLCDVTALSDKVWLQHINGSQHADKQLDLLQRYPAWDCRMGRKSRFNDQPATPKDKERPAHRPQTTNQNSGPQRNKKMAKKAGGGNSKVVCVKFEAQAVDEACLRTLTEPFGKIVKILMFPCLAFVEMGSSDQAKDLEKYYSSNPAAVQGKEVTFQISSTFNFLQSSRVLSFTPAPQGADGFSDLLSIAKRFGAPLYTLALPSLAFIEMKSAADAQKLVDYYSTNSLKINGEAIKVGFSGEYNTLMRVSSAKKYEEQQEGAAAAAAAAGGGGSSSMTKRSRSPSPRESHPKRSRRVEVKEEIISPPCERQGSSSSRRPSSSDSRSQSEEAVATPPAPPGPKAEVEIAAGPDPETCEAGPEQDAEESSDEESDIEGMAVIGEDGESLDDDEEKSAGEDGTPVKVKEEPKEEVEIADKDQTSGPEPKKLEEEEEEGNEGPNFMNFLENCITLDELCEEEECDEDKQEEGESEDLHSTLTHTHPSVPTGKEPSDSGPDEEREEPRRSSRSSSSSRASEKEALDTTTSGPTESIPQPTGTEESSQISPEKEEEESASSRKCSSEEQEVEVPRQEETPPQEVNCLEDAASEPGSEDQEKPDKESIGKTSTTPDGQTQQMDQECEAGCLEDVETKQTAACTERLVQPQPGPVGGSVEPPKPTKPIGAEFVRPVVGYFCNLCEVIYVDEEEAKTKHCSSLTHYQKYKEHTGQDPWSS
ncbi:Matrin-3 [Merluccius polli]|uniref:Matrin-3 n=1 Tax=Merluccius polli TaxID=89951 RepID=A0AA47P6A0_MERPO|nr:Matrin-3 [Merluccius polli]